MYLIIVVGTFFFWGANWMLSVWTNISADELMYHLNAPIKGTNQDVINDGIVRWGVPGGITIIVVAVATILIYKRKGKKFFRNTLIILTLVSLLLAAFSVYRIDSKMHIFEYMKNNSVSSDFIENNYVSPDDVVLQFPEQKRNLVYIYLESMEVTFADQASGGAFDRNVIPELTALARDNEDFSGSDDMLNGGIALPGSTYTMGALWAQSTGLPLKLEVSINDMDTQDSFFPGVVSLGDILERNGYTNELLVGSDAEFGGRALYYRTHGSYDIIDLNTAISSGRLPSGYRVWWGYEDEKLFQYAREEMTRLSESGEPFNVTLLTADTHFEDGYACHLCGDEFGDDQYSNVYACSSRQVAEFVKWIQQQPFYENTTIVISGDHPTMDSDYCENVSWNYQRRTYTTYINSAVTPVNPSHRREYSTMDNFPTTLAAMGVQIQGERLGLGTNLFSDVPTLIESMGLDEIKVELSHRSDYMNAMNTVVINDSYLNRISTRSDLYLYDEDGKLVINLDTYTKLTTGSLIDSIEADVTIDGQTTTLPLEGFKADGNIFYNEDDIDLPVGSTAIVDVYFISNEGERFIIKSEQITQGEN